MCVCVRVATMWWSVSISTSHMFISKSFQFLQFRQHIPHWFCGDQPHQKGGWFLPLVSALGSNRERSRNGFGTAGVSSVYRLQGLRNSGYGASLKIPQHLQVQLVEELAMVNLADHIQGDIIHLSLLK